MRDTKREPREVLDEIRAMLKEAGLAMVGTLVVLDGPLPERCKCCLGTGIVTMDDGRKARREESSEGGSDE
jgi:hypothetical protein